ncbi:MAG TPA: hypothetical protein VN238_07475 [Solirubrobacteraceae bacterium]|nr:hypothetical protein [Solirubrobacteraceae bacterium]
MEQIPVELIVSEESVRAGLAAMERIHGRHLGNMTPDEQNTAREHWRAQVEEVLQSVRNGFEDPPAVLGAGRAVISFADAGGDEVQVGASFMPELRELPGGEVEGTPAQLLALSALESLAEAGAEEGDDEPLV